MDTRTRDERLKHIYQQSAPVVNEDALARRVEAITRGRRRKTFGSSHPRRRAALVALGSLAVLALIGFGIAELVTNLGTDDAVLVITDDDMSPVQTGDPAGHPGASIDQITDNERMDEVPYLQGGLLVWRTHDGHDFEIMVYDFETGATTQLTDNEVDDWEPKVYGDHIAWMQGAHGGPWALHLHDRATGATEKIPEGAVLYGQYHLKGDLLVWARASGDAAQVKIVRLSTGETGALGGWKAPAGDVKVRTDGRYVLVAIAEAEGEAREHSAELRLFDTESGDWTIIAEGAILADWRYLDDRRLADGAVVWSASDGHDAEIFLCDIASGTTTQLTNNDVSDTEPEIGRGYVLWSRAGSLQEPGAESGETREVILYERASGRERLLGQGFGRLAEDGTLAIWSEWPQKAENLYFYDIERDQYAYLGTPGVGASWPDAVNSRVVWYSERLDANTPTAEIMVATVAPSPPTGTTAITREQSIAIAKDFEAEHPHVVPTDTVPAGASTTVADITVTVRSAELVETDAPAITGGRQMLVWIVKLGGTHPRGEIRATIYIDAQSGEILTDLVY